MCSDLDPTGKGQVRWTVRWKPVLNALAVIFGDRFPATDTYSPDGRKHQLETDPGGSNIRSRRAQYK